MLLTGQPAPEARGAPEVWGLARFRHLLHQDFLTLGLVSCHDVLHVALVQGNCDKQAERHANVAAVVAPTPADAGQSEELLRSSPVEAWDIDTDVELVM